MDPGFKAYVSAIDTFSKTEAENGSVPTLKYTENATGYYLLPEDVHNLKLGLLQLEARSWVAFLKPESFRHPKAAIFIR